MKQILFLKNIWRGVNDRGKKLSFESNSYLEFHLSCEGDLGEGEAGGGRSGTRPGHSMCSMPVCHYF